MNMNKYFLITFLVLIGIVMAGIFFYSVNSRGMRMRNNEKNSITKMHEVYKKDCRTFETDGENGQTYKNDTFGFQFLLMRDLLVCERVFTTQKETGEISEISVWERDDFHSSTPRIGPLAIIHIAADAYFKNSLNQFPQSITISKKEITLDGIAATHKELRSSLCIDPDCPIARIYEFEVNDRSFMIEERGTQDVVIGSWKFRDQ